MRNRVIWSIILSAVALAVLPWGLHGAPPGGGGGGSTANGKILFATGENTYAAMNADGSQPQAFFPRRLAYDPWIAVSSKQYGGKRWILVFEDIPTTSRWCDANGENLSSGTVYRRELFAYRSDGVKLQLTDLSKYGLNNDASWSSDVSVVWSNDNADSFFSIRLGAWTVLNGNYVRSYFFPRLIARINLTGQDLETMATMQLAGNPVPPIGAVADPRVTTDPDFQLVLNWTPVVEYDSYDIRTHGWDPSGNHLLYLETDATGTVNLYRRNVATATTIDADPDTESVVMANFSGSYPHVDWSPDGSKIAVSDGGSIRLVNPDGSGPQTLRAASSKSGASYQAPYWSPDGKWIAYRTFLASGSYVAKYPVAGGKEVLLTKTAPYGRWTLGWSAE